jgi:EAL domain-containing protein (putative c-di-GMP-specific phosphodiesterase class I)
MNKEGEEFLILGSKIYSSLKNNEFFLNFQPKLDIKTNKVIGAEALIRWISNGEFVPPDKFIPVAETTGFIDEIGEFVLKEALKSINIIKNEGH